MTTQDTDLSDDIYVFATPYAPSLFSANLNTPIISIMNISTPVYLSGLVAGCVLGLIAVRESIPWKVDGFPLKLGLPFFGSWEFLSDRDKFVEDGLRRFGDCFVFYIMRVCFCSPCHIYKCLIYDLLSRTKYFLLRVKVLAARSIHIRISTLMKALKHLLLV